MYIHSAGAPGGGAASLLGVAISLNTGNQAQQVIPVACAKRRAADELIFHHCARHGVLRGE